MKAIMMVSNRDYVLRSTKGSKRFLKGEPTLVSPFLVPEALAVGIIPADGEPAVEAEAPTPDRPLNQADRNADILKAMATMEDRAGTKAGREDWTAGRRPKVGVVSKLVGYKVQSQEINRIIEQRNEEANAAKLEAKKSKGKKKAVAKEPEGGEDYGS